MKQLPVLLLTIFLFFVSDVLKAQQNHYVYIQTENRQAFYVRLNNKQYSSSISGYLIVPKLKEGNYNMAIGFPKNEWPEQNLGVTIANDDIGFLLKNFGDKGWGLFNFQSLDVTMAVGIEKTDNIEVVNRTDAFSNMLSSVVNDSTIKQTETVKKVVEVVPAKEPEKVSVVEAKEKEVILAIIVDSPKEEIKSPIVTEEKTKSIVLKETKKTELIKEQPVEETASKSTITRSLFTKNAEGTEMVFVDELNGLRDTIRVFIPAEKNLISVVEEKPVNIEIPIAELKQDTVVKQDEKVKDAKFLEIELPNPNQKTAENKPEENKVVENNPVEKSVPEGNRINKEEAKVETVKPADEPAQKAIMINSDCKSFASDDDFLKLRKKMAAVESDDEMVTIAKKVFKAKCFTVEQIKNLSVLFLKDAGKYAFFDMTYPFAADSHNFHILQSQLTDAYFISRFQAMIRH